jgi:predicted negative regulator of RcsB-dependent stress response
VRSQTRHQLKQDQFSARASEAVDWTVEHRDKLIYAGIAAAAIVAVALGIWLYLRQQNEAAGAALGKALQVYNAPILPAGQAPAPDVTSFASAQERAKAAKAEFQKAAAYHGNSADMARYFIGLCDIDLGNTADAEKELQASTSGPADVASLAKMGLASLYRRTGKDAEAVKIYKDLMDHPTNTVGKTEAQLELASLYEPTQPQEARLIYQQIQKENPQGAAAQIAADRLANLK